MLAVARRILRFAGIDEARHDALLFHKGLHAVAPHVPAVRIGFDALLVERVDMDVFLVLEGLQQPAQAIADRWLLRHRTVLEQLAVARFVVAQDNVKFVHRLQARWIR